MKLFWVSCYCGANTFDKLFEILKSKPEVSIQHYLSLLLSGININGVQNITISERQISRGQKPYYWKSYKEELKNGDIVEYLPFLTIPLLGQIIRANAVFFKLLGYLIWGEKPRVIICDVMRFWVSTPALLFGKIFKVKVVGFAADIPQMYFHQYKGKVTWIQSLLRKLYSSITTHYDAYIELSSYMDECINPKKRPKIVIEGIVGSSEESIFKIKNKEYAHSNKIILYTGGLYEKYGVKMLVDAVAERKDSSIELWLLGKGELETYIQSVSSPNIKFFGYCPHEKVIAMQQDADFLINPRFSNEDYTKYSFPSKIMEYLVSGTPIIGTRLKGIPDDYFDYIIPIEEETISGLNVVFDKILHMTASECEILGKKGKQYVLQQKNNIIQSNRLIDWIENNFN